MGDHSNKQHRHTTISTPTQHNTTPHKNKHKKTHLEDDARSKGDVAGDSEVVELENVRDGLEAAQKVGYFLEVVVAKLHKRDRRKEPQRVHRELAMAQLRAG